MLQFTKLWLSLADGNFSYNNTSLYRRKSNGVKRGSLLPNKMDTKGGRLQGGGVNKMTIGKKGSKVG